MRYLVAARPPCGPVGAAMGYLPAGQQPVPPLGTTEE